VKEFVYPGRGCRRVSLLVLFWIGLIFAPATLGQGGNDALWEKLSAFDQTQGKFLQELYSEEGELLERSTGQYAVLKPGFFRWEIEYPDRQRILVGNDVIWHYDIDLATATQRAVRSADEFFALDLLTSDSASLKERFEVQALTDNRYRLLPTYPQAGFVAVELGWRDGMLVAMDIRDRSNQQIRLSLTPESDTEALAPADFSFVPPEGVDVFTDSPL